MGQRQGARHGHGSRWTLGHEDPPIDHGAALGAGGVEGWWAWKHRRQTRRGVESVSPATWRGTLHVMVWSAGLVAITVVGPLVVGWPRPVWFCVAVVVMVGVGWLWDRRSQRPDATSDDPAE